MKNEIRNVVGFFIFLWMLVIACDTPAPQNEEVEIEDTDSLFVPGVAYYDSLILANPKDANLYFQRAIYYRDMDIAPPAIADIYSAINLDSSRADFYYVGADLHMAMNDVRSAISLMSQGINQFPKDEELYLRATEYNYIMMHYEAALNFVNDLLRINPYNADAYFLKGMIYKEQGFSEKAKSTFQTCTEQDPTFYNAYMQLGLLHTDDKSDMAIAYFDNALRIVPESREAMYGKAYYRQVVEDYEGAIADYRSLIQFFPKDHISFYNIGFCYLQIDSLGKSYSHFNIATQLQPQYAGAYYMKGVVSEQAGDLATALMNYEQASVMMPDNENVQNALNRLQ